MQCNVCAHGTYTAHRYICMYRDTGNVIPLQCVATQHPLLEKRSAQTDKIQTKIHNVQTDPLDIKHGGSQYNSTNRASTSTLTDGPTGLDVCIAADPLVNRHIQTPNVKAATTKKVGPNTKYKSSQSELFPYIYARVKQYLILMMKASYGHYHSEISWIPRTNFANSALNCSAS